MFRIQTTNKDLFESLKELELFNQTHIPRSTDNLKAIKNILNSANRNSYNLFVKELNNKIAISKRPGFKINPCLR